MFTARAAVGPPGMPLALDASQLSANVKTPTMGPVTVGIGTSFRYTLEGPPGYDQTDLHTLQQFLVSRQLKTVPGVADVITFGGLSR
ncbi:MAG: hypothetical protein ABI895_35195 [Deltaproteobacteria bacterium]